MGDVITATATVEGLSALLMHRFGEQAEVEQEARAVKLDSMTPLQAAERTAYQDDQHRLYVPGACIARLLREAGGGHKQRGTRKSLKYIVPAAVIIPDDMLLLHGDDPGKHLRVSDIEVDSRPVTIPATKGRIMRHRARVEQWRCTFLLEIDTAVLDVATIHQLLEEGGRRIGIGDYRPEKGGPYGRFAIVSWTDKP